MGRPAGGPSSIGGGPETMSSVELHEKIPNNVHLSSDQRLKRALEEWQPHFLAWWREMGPDRFQEDAIYLRTAVSVDASGWAHFDYVRMPEYRWGIFLAEPVPDRRIGFGNDFGQPVWQEVPAEHRNTLSRTCRFMLTEEAHHMFVGESGMSRIVERTAECLRAGTEPRSAGALDLATIQKYLNSWYSLSLDLFGSEVSTNAAQFFGAGLKGRPREEERYEDHLALEGGYEMDVYEAGKLVRKPIALRSAMNEVLRDAYVEDCQKALGRWNKRLAGTGAELVLPSRRFHREQGMFAGHCFDPAGHEITAEELARRRDEWLPSDADRAYVRSLMAHPVLEPGHFASWIAPPPRGINGQPIDFRYVRYNEQ